MRERQEPGTDTPGVGGDGGIPTIQEYLLQLGPRLPARFGHGRKAIRKEVERRMCKCPGFPFKVSEFHGISESPFVVVLVLCLYQTND